MALPFSQKGKKEKKRLGRLTTWLKKQKRNYKKKKLTTFERKEKKKKKERISACLEGENISCLGNINSAFVLIFLTQ